ncbi:MAG: DUF2271 domain-containing protein [Gammaproteobacteria bacterium]
MRSSSRARLIALALAVALPASLVVHPARASELSVAVEVPKLDVAEYHRPYLAVWIEREDQSVAANLSVWYQDKKGEGTKWLNELRTWWRKSGREQSFPIDGVTGPTKPVGIQQLTFAGGKPPLASLAPGKYRLVVEAARESGGREVVRVPFEWPAKTAQSLTGKGSSELGTVALNLTP